jgi:RNA-directed DNA polymerase
VQARQGPTTPPDRSRQLQRRLYVAAQRSRNRRFHARYERIFRPARLGRAWQEVRSNGGAAGGDGVTREAGERHGAEPLLAPSRPDLRAGTYRPPPVLRGYLAKPDGGPRPLGLPTVRDRVVQQACKRVIEPIVEAHCQNTSDGWRAKRSAHPAVNAVKHALMRGWWGVEAAIHRDFDPIDPTRLVSLVARRMSERRVLKLSRQWLHAGVVAQGQGQLTEVGAPPGGVISPVLVHIDLPVLDLYWVTRYAGLGELCRYADAIVSSCRTPRQAEHAVEAVRRILQTLTRQLHPTPTRLVARAQEGFDFLGFQFPTLRAPHTGKLRPSRWPRQQAMKAIRRERQGLTSRQR